MNDDSDGPSSAAMSAASCRSTGSSVDGDRADQVAQRGEVPALEAGAQPDQRRVPLPVLGDAVEAAVVQLVADGEADLEVLVGQRAGAAAATRSACSMVAADSAVPPARSAEQGLAERPPGLGQMHGPSMPTDARVRCAAGM